MWFGSGGKLCFRNDSHSPNEFFLGCHVTTGLSFQDPGWCFVQWCEAWGVFSTIQWLLPPLSAHSVCLGRLVMQLICQASPYFCFDYCPPHHRSFTCLTSAHVSQSQWPWDIVSMVNSPLDHKTSVRRIFCLITWGITSALSQKLLLWYFQSKSIWDTLILAAWSICPLLQCSLVTQPLGLCTSTRWTFMASLSTLAVMSHHS